ncbi:autophagy- protein 2 [Trapelia coarctata]|nr:autophagy- protein 2 [Trapelia coarctata]
MAYFIPSYIQKRILRYALSHIDWLDTDALDLDRLDIVFGRRSTAELRDVGLRLEQLAALLHLPSCLIITKARAILVRITVPADLHSSGILVEVEGVEGQLLINPEALGKPPSPSSKARSSRRADTAKGIKTDRPRSTPPIVHDPGGAQVTSTTSTPGAEDQLPGALPTTADLARSFLQHEPAQERAELQAAISKSQHLAQSVSSEGDEGLDTGLGAGFSLPGFIADFLKGVGDRLRLDFRRVRLDLDLKLDLPCAGHPANTPIPNSETLTLRITVDSVKVDEFTPQTSSNGGGYHDTTSGGGGGRQISLVNVRCMILSDASVFDLVGHSPGHLSPTAPRSNDRSKESSQVSHDAFGLKSQASSSSADPDLMESTILGAITDPEKYSSRLAANVKSSDDEDHVAHGTDIRLPGMSMYDSVSEHSQHQGILQPRVVLQRQTHERSTSTHDIPSDVAETAVRDGNRETASEISPVEKLNASFGSEQFRPTLHEGTRPHSNSVSPSSSDGGTAGRSASVSDEDLTQSKIFSHDEGHSLYMSAISQIHPRNSQAHAHHGAWGASSFNTEVYSSEIGERSSHGSRGSPTSQLAYLAEMPINRGPVGQRPVSSNQEEVVSTLSQSSPLQSQLSPANVPAVVHKSPVGSPEASSEDETSQESQKSGPIHLPTRLIKQLFMISTMSFFIPQENEANQATDTGKHTDHAPTRSGKAPTGIPGAFADSDASELFTPDVSKTPQVLKGCTASLNQESKISSETSFPISVSVDDLSLVGDMSLTRLLVMVAEQLSSLRPLVPDTKSIEPNLEHPSYHLTIHLTRLSWKFVDVIRGLADGASQQLDASTVDATSPADSDILLAVTIKDLEIAHKNEGLTSNTGISIGKFEFGYSGDSILAFDSGLRMRESTRDVLAPADKDLAITVLQTPESLSIKVTTLPLHITLDLARLDETFSWFGGLSSVLGLGSSMMSTVTAMEPKSKPSSGARRPRGVRFDTPEVEGPLDQTGSTQQKVTVRIGGLLFDLQGKESSLRLESTAVKLVSRAEGIGVQLDRLKFGGPFLRQSYGTPPISIRLGNVRVEYLPNPKEVDLARLLALLSPSRDRDETNDDILLETLFRQRRQGGVIRYTVETVEGSLTKLEDLDHLHLISEELTKLSTVAKYLPEDDRPGILNLVLLRKLRLEAEVNNDFGSAEIVSQNIELAHVTLPSLTLLGIDKLSIHRQNEELLGEALPLNADSEQQSPMVMARLIGDEMEPTVKFKLWNLRVEYHVTTLMAILGLSETVTGEVIITDLVSSVTTLTGRRRPPKLASQSSHTSEKSSTGGKGLRFEISMRDSIIGLNPRFSSSRGLVVFSNTKMVGSLPRKDQAELGGHFEIKKASFMIIDSVKNVARKADLPGSTLQTDQRSLVQSLAAMGYVAVSDVSSAKITWRICSSGKYGEKSIDVEVRDDLFVLETCADSTQTLQSILSGLSPPMPPSQELKYRTEVVPVADMLASFTGDAYSTGEKGMDNEADLPLELEEGDMMDDDVPQNLEFVSSFYNPNPESLADDIANSILEGDFGDLAGPPITRELGDRRLLQSFQEQFEVAPGNEPLKLDENYFGSGSETDGTAHRWSSDRNTYDLDTERNIRRSPLRLRVRDVHIIWNLFDGYDWQHTRDAIGQAVADVETKAAEKLARKDKRISLDVEEKEEAVIGDFLFNSIYIGISANHDPRELSRQVNRNIDDLTSEAESYATSTTVQGSPSRQAHVPRMKRKKLRLERSKHHKMTFELRGVSVDLVVLPPSSGETQSSIDIRVQDLEIFDHVPTSTWKKFATYMHDAGERQSGSSMVHIKIINVRPVPELAASEVILQATVLPLRLHVDQDALDFMTRFFEFKDDSAVPTQSSSSESMFFQRAEINAVQVKLDFKPKRVDYAGIRSGHTTEFMNFFILDQADMVLRHVIIYGVSGFEKLGKTLNDIWMPDIKRNQLPGVLAGLAPVRSLVNVGGGVKDLVLIPIREYKKDGRIMRSIQKGAFSFAKTTTTELAKLGAKLALGTQTVLQGAEDYLVQPSGPQRLDNWESADIDEDEKKHISLYADQPVGVMQGLRGAYRHLERDLAMAKDAIIAMPGEVMESGTAGGAARAVLRNAPTVILRPALGVTKAVGQTLLGATNSLDKAERRRIEDKYKRH